MWSLYLLAISEAKPNTLQHQWNLQELSRFDGEPHKQAQIQTRSYLYCEKNPIDPIGLGLDGCPIVESRRYRREHFVPVPFCKRVFHVYQGNRVLMRNNLQNRSHSLEHRKFRLTDLHFLGTYCICGMWSYQNFLPDNTLLLRLTSSNSLVF